jgi:hypothetical protein
MRDGEVLTYALSISGAAVQEGVTTALERFAPSAQIEWSNASAVRSIDAPDWLVAAATIFTVTGGFAPTIDGFRLLLDFATGIRAKYPTAPVASLHLSDGVTGDSIDLEGADREWAEARFMAWLDSHRVEE